MAITFVGNSKDERDRARSVAVDYLIKNPTEKLIWVYKRKFNYHTEKDEIVHAGTVFREKEGFYWVPVNDRSSCTYINRRGESLDPVWWYQVKKSVKGNAVASEKTLSDARAKAVRMLMKDGGKYLYISKSGYETLGLVSKSESRGFVWVTYKNPRDPVAFKEQYVLHTDGKLGKKLW